MTKNYLTYPCKVMNITQGYTGSYTHSQHNIGSPKDYPWDEACEGSGRSAMYCPCDEIKIKKIYGVGNRGTNTIWLESTSKVFFADGTSGYFTMLIIHPNDSDIRGLYVGQKFKRGQIICYEGTDGNATGNHFHFSAGKGKNGTWTENSRGKWVLTCSGGTYKPEKLFYIDPEFTTVKNAGGIVFKELPKTYEPGKYVVTAELLRVREGAGTKYKYKKFDELSASAQKKILALTRGKKADGYVKGLEFSVVKVEDGWGYNKSGWMCLEHCEKR